MAPKNVLQEGFSPDEAKILRINLMAARSVLRTLIFALEAVNDGSMSFDDESEPARWGPAVGEVRARLAIVRDLFLNSVHAPSGDWFTPLTLIEAMDAALFRDVVNTPGMERLDGDEVISVAQVVIEALDSLMETVNAANVHDVNAMRPEAAPTH